MEGDPCQLLTRTGARGHSRGTWDAWSLFIAEYPGGKRLYPLLQPDHATPGAPTATILDQRRECETHQRNAQSLWFLPAQDTKGSAAAIVARCEHDGREAWLKLERIHGRRAQDKRPVQLLASERRLWDLQCNFEEGSTNFVAKLDTSWGEFEVVPNVKAEETKRAALLLGNKEAIPQVFIQLTTQPGMMCEELKRAAAASSTCLISDMTRSDEAV